ncbi:hypothetical protein FMUAM8_30680 [Nocardia cyriacigeorgica]|nr:hypothetical protein FMUAM8_30680 [Nocardia cyriacigeorgica]
MANRFGSHDRVCENGAPSTAGLNARLIPPEAMMVRRSNRSLAVVVLFLMTTGTVFIVAIGALSLLTGYRLTLGAVIAASTVAVLATTAPLVWWRARAGIKPDHGDQP